MTKHTILGIAAIILCLSALAGAFGHGLNEQVNSVLPATPAGARVQKFLEAYNSGEASRLERYFGGAISPAAAQQLSPAERAARWMQVRGEVGRVALKKVEFPSPDSIAIFAQGERGSLVLLDFRFSPAPEFFLMGIMVEDASPEDLAGLLAPMTQREALAAVEKTIDQAADSDDFSGVVLVARREQTLLHRACGLANREFEILNRLDTKFNLGSINKIFTRLAASQLIEKGKLSLDDNLGKYVPEYPNKDAAAKVTIRHLIEMKSGIGDFFGVKFAATPKDVFRRNSDFLPMFADKPLAFEPGTQQQYSNGGYVVLGEVIARASGMDYYDYVRKNIFEPAGMTNTDSYEADFVVPNLAEGYTRNWDGNEHPGTSRRRNLYTRPARGSSAGGGYSTAADMLRFANALKSDTLLSPAYTDWLLNGSEPSARSKITAGPRSKGNLGIAGGAPGINAALELDLETGYTVIVLGNYDPPAATDVARKIRRLLGAIRN
jgi:CubicO group peptidase (beta-lactamase class C family)